MYCISICVYICFNKSLHLYPVFLMGGGSKLLCSTVSTSLLCYFLFLFYCYFVQNIEYRALYHLFKALIPCYFGGK